MSYTTAAAYNPDCMVITLKPHFDALANPTDIRGFVGPEQIGFFFHEWCHFLHNISTLHGITAFTNSLALWASFRFTKKDCAYSAGASVLEPELTLNSQQRYQYLATTRSPATANFPTALLSSLKIKSTHESRVEIVGSTLSVAKVRFNVCRTSDPETEWEIEIGAHEIVEGLAWMLEEKLVTALGGNCPPPSIIPYQVVRNIFRLRIPAISDDAIIACMLRLLQDSDPPGALIDTLNAAEAMMQGSLDIIAEMSKFTQKILEKNEPVIERFISDIEGMFPLNEPFMAMIAHTAALMRRNLQKRRIDPFFEFSIIDSLKQDVQNMDRVIGEYGGCGVIQERPGHIDDFTRDLMYDFGSPVEADSSLEFGRRKMHAAFRYMMAHLSVNGFIPTESVALRAAKPRCPFYTTCDLNQRKDHALICRTSPWKAAEIHDEEILGCWYRAGVIATTGSP